MRYFVLAVLFLALIPHVAAGRDRVCVVLPATEEAAQQTTDTVPNGKRELYPADSAALADVQRSFLKKYDVAATCKPADLRLVALATAFVTRDVPERAFVVADVDGTLHARHTGSTTVVDRVFYIDVYLPGAHRGTQPHELVCATESDKDPAKGCVKQFQEWQKLQGRLAR